MREHIASGTPHDIKLKESAVEQALFKEIDEVIMHLAIKESKRRRQSVFGPSTRKLLPTEDSNLDDTDGESWMEV